MRCLVRRVLFFLLTYAMLCTAVGIFVAEGALHPQRRHLTPAASVQPMTFDQSATLREVSIARGNATLRAWCIRPTKPNGDAVILLHGLGDNRTGMTGYARILLSHGYGVLLPDARAQGASDGGVATMVCWNATTSGAGSSGSRPTSIPTAFSDWENPWVRRNYCSLCKPNRVSAR
jgi:pimeloyl-ACP methyl ester carboxylesterase